ncbi:MAG: hypothetical protein IJO87_03515 [Eggerthellaceae bacterium]|nr:hypothetical protein [Eggerthellaceae bacterium]
MSLIKTAMNYADGVSADWRKGLFRCSAMAQSQTRGKAFQTFAITLVSLALAATMAACSPANVEAPETGNDTPGTSAEAPDKGNSTSAPEVTPATPVPEAAIFSPEQVEAAEIELTMIRQGLIGSDYMCAVAMMGYAEEDLEDFLLEAIRYFPAVAAIPSSQWIEAEGDEVYLVVPRSTEASVAVNEWVVSPSSSTGPYEGEAGEVLYRSDRGDPIIVRGNISDIRPNLMINIVDEFGDSLRYIPFCNTMDGTLDTPPGEPGVLDYTSHFSFPVYPDEVAGDWTCFYACNEDGEQITCSLTIGVDGYLAYAWGPANGMFENYYEGSWKYSPLAGAEGVPDEAVSFMLMQVDGAYEASSVIAGTYALAIYPESPEYLYVKHVDGDALAHTQKVDGVLEFGIALG